jgi:hypothetical protein
LHLKRPLSPENWVAKWGYINVFWEWCDYSPDGQKFQSKPELVRATSDSLDLTTFDFATGKCNSLLARRQKKHRGTHYDYRYLRQSPFKSPVPQILVKRKELSYLAYKEIFLRYRKVIFREKGIVYWHSDMKWLSQNFKCNYKRYLFITLQLNNRSTFRYTNLFKIVDTLNENCCNG